MAKWDEDFTKYVFKGKSEQEIDDLRKSCIALGEVARQEHDNGNYTYDENIPAFENIAENATDVLDAKQKELQAQGVKTLRSGVRVYPADFEA